MIPRPRLVAEIRKALRRSPAVSILGPRQCGKTTLATSFARGRRARIFDLEDPSDLARLSSPKLALESLQGLIVLDEAQRLPELFPVLRVLIDRPAAKARFILLGSASPRLVRAISESLTGRVGLIEMRGFDILEAGSDRATRLWLRGGFPRSFLAATEEASFAWRRDFIQTYLERELPPIGITVPSAALRRFWTMVAHYHGQIWNAAELARSLGSSEPTARRYLDILSGAYLVRQLPPWFENLAKRQVKAPKVYIRDSGLLHALLSIESIDVLTAHPKYGASWEGFALEQVLSLAGPEQAYFWATHAGAELDLLLLRNNRRLGFEFKCAEAPRMSKSMQVASRDLRLDRLFVVYPGTRAYPLERNVDVIPLGDLAATLGRRGARA